MDREIYELEKRIAMLTNRVFSLEKEVDSLKSQLGAKETNIIAQPVANPQVNPIVQSEAVSKDKPTAQPAAQSAVQPQITPAYQPTLQPQVKPTYQPAAKKTMESRIGKNLMGILASVLILFSIILFGGLIYPFISDAFKVAVMYLISIGLATFGILKMRRDNKYSTLFTAISATGVSAVYVSTLITYFGFHMISEILLLIIMAIWLVITGVLAKLKSSIFTYICNIGLIISSFLAMLQWNTSVMGMLLYFLGLFALFGFNYKKEFNRDIYYFIQIPIMSIIFAFFYYKGDAGIAALSFLAFINLAALVFPNIFYNAEEKSFPYILINSILTFISTTVSVLSLNWAVDDDYKIILFAYFMVMVAVAVLYYALYVKRSGKFGSLFYVIFYLSLCMTPFTYYTGFVKLFIGWPVLFIALIIVGMVLDNKHFRYSGYGLMLLSLASYPYSYWVSFLIVILSIVGIGIYLSRHYCVVDKYIITPILILGISLLGTEGFNFNVALLLFILLSFILNTRLFLWNPEAEEKEKASEVFSKVYTAIVTLVLPFYISNCDIGFTYSQGGDMVFATSSEFAVAVYSIMLLAIILVRIAKMFKEDDRFSRLFIAVVAFLCIVTNTETVGMYFLMLGFVAITLIALLVQLKNKYREYDKYIITGIVLAFILSLFEYANLPIPFICLSVMSLFMNTRMYRLNPNKEEESIAVLFGYIMNAIMMFVGIVCIFSYEKPMEIVDTQILSPTLSIFMMSLFTIALFVINTKKALDLSISKNLSGVYVCFKYTLLVIAILARLKAASYVFSMVGLVLAIIFIVTGFRLRYKSFRMYGLILTLLSVLKLILFDIEYSSDILRPVGIFISGVLCFVISFIYSKIEKQISEKNEG